MTRYLIEVDSDDAVAPEAVAGFLRLHRSVVVATVREWVPEVSTVETGSVHVAQSWPANEAVANYLFSLPEDGGWLFDPGGDDVNPGLRYVDKGESVSHVLWVRLANGNLYLAMAPQGATYEVVEQVVDDDYLRAQDLGTVVTHGQGGQ